MRCCTKTKNRAPQRISTPNGCRGRRVSLTTTPEPPQRNGQLLHMIRPTWEPRWHAPHGPPPGTRSMVPGVLCMGKVIVLTLCHHQRSRKRRSLHSEEQYLSLSSESTQRTSPKISQSNSVDLGGGRRRGYTANHRLHNRSRDNPPLLQFLHRRDCLPSVFEQNPWRSRSQAGPHETGIKPSPLPPEQALPSFDFTSYRFASRAVSFVLPDLTPTPITSPSDIIATSETQI